MRRNYTRPRVDEGDCIEIVEGRHPVVEATLAGAPFIPNDVRLDADRQIIVLTGPNMAGKSTYLRQAALTVLMAQVGSFVAARSAHVGMVDRIFTRVGAQDEIASGASTFMVEMTETSYILTHATPRSLVVFDEVGRGTSTYDGLAIARAVLEYLHNHSGLQSKTLFATHFHELAELEGTLPRVRNSRVDVLEEQGNVVFLHKVVPGGAGPFVRGQRGETCRFAASGAAPGRAGAARTGGTASAGRVGANTALEWRRSATAL